MPNNKEPEEKIAYVLEAIRWESGDAKTEIHVIPREDLGKKDCFESIGLFYSDTWDPSKKFYYSLDGSTWFTDRNQENGTLSNEIVVVRLKKSLKNTVEILHQKKT